jgi:hypothetical protein
VHDRDIAVKCLFLNRTTFSGILHGRAGPMGGRKQQSDYKIDCRFNKDGLRLVDLRYSASAVNAHRGQRQELLLTTLPPSCVPLNDRMHALPT